MTDDHDFGFTFADEDEITGPAIIKVHDDNKKTVVQLYAQIDQIVALIRPFLKNLQAEPDKLYLKWPDRAAKVKAFSDTLEALVQD